METHPRKDNEAGAVERQHARTRRVGGRERGGERVLTGTKENEGNGERTNEIGRRCGEALLSQGRKAFQER